MRTQLSSAMALALQVAAMERAPGRVAEERALTLRLMPTPSFHAPDTVAPTPIGGLRPNGGKYGPFTLGARERSRLAWRQRVDAAARAYHSERMAWRARVWDGKFGTFDWRVFKELFDALAAPRPWRSPRKPDPRRRYSRSHRRACWRCRRVTYWVAEAKWARKCGRPEYRRFVTRELIWFRRNPHGRSDR